MAFIEVISQKLFLVKKKRRKNWQVNIFFCISQKSAFPRKKNLISNIAVARIFFVGGGDRSRFSDGGGSRKKKFRKHIKIWFICMFLPFYESDKISGRGSSPLPPLLDTTLISVYALGSLFQYLPIRKILLNESQEQSEEVSPKIPFFAVWALK